MSTTPSVRKPPPLFRLTNPVMRRLLAIGSGGPLGRGLILVRFQGRKSGRWFTNPVAFARDGDLLIVVTLPTYAWWRNLVGGAAVDVRIGGRWRTADARLIAPDVDELVVKLVRHRGTSGMRRFGVAVNDDGTMTPEVRAAAAEKVRIVTLRLNGDAPASR